MQSIQQLTSKNKEKLQGLEELLGYKFADGTLLQKALVHSSFGFEQINDGQNNETRECLGDAVLDLSVSDMLYRRYPGIKEGELTKIRAGLVQEATLARMAKTLKLGDFLLFGKGEEASNGRKKPSILACAFEALIGAIYLDSDYEQAHQFINSRLTPLLPENKDASLVEDAKSLLQEKLQERFNQAPTYHLDAEEGPAHAKRFTVAVMFKEEVLGKGTGSSKKVAEKLAAEAALDTIDSWWEKVAATDVSPDK